MLGAGGVPVSFWILDPSIVGDVDDEGVIAQVALFQNVDQLPTGLIKPGTHRIVLCDRQGKAHIPVGLEQSLGRVVGGMRKEYPVPKEERLFLGYCMIDEFLDRLQSGPANLQPVVSMSPAGLGKPAGHSMGKSAVLVVSFPPFSTLVTEVAFFTKEFGQGVKLVEVGNQLSAPLVVELALGVLWGRIVSSYPMLVGILAGSQGQERWTAQRGGDVSAFEDHAFLVQFVQVRGLDFRMPHESVIGPCLIIGDDIENVGRLFGGCESAPQEEA